MHDDVETPARPDAHPDAAGGRGVWVVRTVCLLSGWVVAMALSACGGGGSDATPPAAGASAPPAAAASGVTVSGPDGASLFVPDGATATPVTFRIAKDSTGATPLPSVVAPAGDVYAITPHGATLSAFVTVRIPIDPGVPADAVLVLAQSAPGDIWHFRSGATRNGSTLEFSTTSLSLFRVVRLDAAAVAASRGRASALSANSMMGIRISAPGFAADGASSLFNPTPYPTATLVPVRLEPYSNTRGGLSTFCANADAIRVSQYSDRSGPGLDFLPLEQYDLATTPAAPWTFDLRVHRLPGTSPTNIYAEVTVACNDGTVRFNWDADEYLRYRVTDASAVAFFEPPTGVSIAPGQTAAFQVRVVGGPKAATDRDEYRLFWERSDDGGAVWRTIGTSYQHESSSTPDEWMSLGWAHRLSIGSVASAENGALIRARACYAPPGSIEQCASSASARLTVVQSLVPPTITSQPTSMATLVAETANFSVGVAGTPTPTVQWQVLPSATGAWLDVGSAGASWPGASPNALTLVTPAATPDANGWLFRAVVANAAGSITSDAVVWRVSQAPIAPAFTVQPASTSVLLGTTALFAAAAEGTAPLSYQWSKEGTPILGATAPVLALGNVQATDLASYRLTVSGPGGSATSNPATLSASQGPAPAVPPLVSMQPTPATVPLGMAATFRVAVTGSPGPACQWMRNGIAIPGAASCDSYTTPPATAADNGAVYNVVATNAGGSVLAGGAVLTVQGSVAPSGWQFLTTGSSAYLYDLTIVPGRPNRIITVGLDGVILLSDDGGASWTQAYPTRPATARSINKVRFLDSMVGVAVGPYDIVRTDDGGVTWANVWRVEDNGGGFQYLQALDWLDADTAIAVGLSRVWRSTDRGQTWQVFGTFDFLPLQIGTIGGVRFLDALTGVLTSNYRMFRTVDGGLSWTELPGAFTTFADPLYGVARGSTPQTVVAVGGSGVYRSTDAGATWTRSAVSGYLIGLSAHGPEMVAAGDRGVVLRSGDDGATWTAQPSVAFGIYWGVDFAGPTIFVAGAGGVVARHD